MTKFQEEKVNKKILIATFNPAKQKEIEIGLIDLKKRGFLLLSLRDLKIKAKVEETGKTFCENAKLKAKFYAELTGYPTIADDGGLIIPYLNNEPGVKSRRWLGYEASDEELIKHTLLHLRGVKGVDRTAYLQVCLCFYDPKTKKIISEQEKIKGYIAEKPSGKATDGYPFRALFIVEKFNKYYDELTEEEHWQINHRLKALKRLVHKIITSLF